MNLIYKNKNKNPSDCIIFDKACIRRDVLFSKIKEILIKHFQGNFFLYLLVIISLLIGISAGAITINVLDNNQKQEIISFLNSFLRILKDENNIDNFLLLKQSLVNNAKVTILIWILGITVIGIPIVIAIVALRGFIIGFTVGFLFDEFGLKGLIFSLLAILPQNIFVIPGIVILSVFSIKFSITIITRKKIRNGKNGFSKDFFQYTAFTLFIFVLFIISSMLEAYITPSFMKIISGYLT